MNTISMRGTGKSRYQIEWYKDRWQMLKLFEPPIASGVVCWDRVFNVREHVKQLRNGKSGASVPTYDRIVREY